MPVVLEQSYASSAQMLAAISRLRRAVGDTDSTNYSYTDSLLYEYIADGVNDLELGEYSKNIIVSDGDFRSQATNVSVTVADKEITIYVIKAHILLKQGVKDKADRENFSLRKGKLTVDTSGQSKDMEDTLMALRKQLRDAIRAVRGPIEGVRVE